MGIMAIIGAAVTLLIEIFKLVNDIRRQGEKHDEELRKKKTQVAQSGIRGLIDGDAGRVISAVDELRRMRQK